MFHFLLFHFHVTKHPAEVFQPHAPTHTYTQIRTHARVRFYYQVV